MKITKGFIRFYGILTSVLTAVYFIKIPKALASLWDVANRDKEMEKIGEAFGSTAGNPTDPRQVTVNVIKVFLSLLAIIFVVLIIVAGFKWMNAAGNQDRVSEAKSQLRSAIIGLIIILAAWSITYFVTEYLLCAIDDSWVWCN